MTGLAVTVAGWAGFALAAAIAVRARWAAWERGEAVARACHEVRGPLAAALLGLEAGAGGSLAPRLRAIEVELARASVALDDLQAARQVAPGAGEPGVVDVVAWLNDSVEAWRPVALAGGMDVQLDWEGPEVLVWGRQSRLAQVTGNLIANAIEHGGVGVEVRGRVDQERVVIEVIDDGPGLVAMPEALMETAGRHRWPGVGGMKWGRGRRDTRGRGLLITRAVVEAHGGQLATAPSDRGARLVVTLPIAGF